MQNPVVAICKEKGITLAELAIMSQMSGPHVYQFRNGYAKRLRGRVLEVLVSLGYEREELVAQYAEWRNEQLQELAKKHIG